MKGRRREGRYGIGRKKRKGWRGLKKMRWREKREETVLENVREEDQDGGEKE